LLKRTRTILKEYSPTQIGKDFADIVWDQEGENTEKKTEKKAETMARGKAKKNQASSSWSNECEEENEVDYNKKVDSLIKRLDDGKNVDDMEYKQVVLQFIMKCDKKDKEIENLKTQIDEMKADMKKMEASFQTELKTLHNKEEINMAKRGIIIRGIDENGDEESQEDTQMKIDHVLHEVLELEKSSVESVRRVKLSEITKKKLQEKNIKPARPVLVRFKSAPAKFALYGKLKKLQGYDDAKGWRIQTDIPMCLKETFAKLEEKAYQLRTDEKAKTRIKWDKLAIKLQAKALGSDKYVDVD